MRLLGSRATGPSRGTRLRAISSCFAIALALLVVSGAVAEESGRAVRAELLQKAWTRGKVRVIVELGQVGAVPEGRLLSHAAVAAQRGRIASDRAALRTALRGLRHRVLREFKTVPYVGLEVDHDTLRVLDALPGLATRVHEDILLRPTLAQSGPLIKAPDAWAGGWDGSGQVVAILDTGVDKNHPFLAGKVVAEACYDSSGVTTCPNGLTSDTSPGAGIPCTFAPDDCFHGTHVAGIAAGNGPSFDGVARGAGLIAIQVFHRVDDPGECAPDPTPCARASWMDLVAALEQVHALRETHAIAAANLSLGAGSSTAPCDADLPDMTLAIGNLKSEGIATVVSSGNEEHVDAISFPACISTAISVGATGDNSGGYPTDQVTFFSNTASFLSLLAPGALINSSTPGGGFSNAAGTSMAAPHVAGAWAIARQANPEASVDDVLLAFRNTGRPIVDPGNDLTFYRIAATVLQFSAPTYSVAETGGNAIITVTRSGSMFGPHFAPLTVDYATSANGAVPGQDYVETSNALVFNAGDVSKTFTVPILNDSKADGLRKVKLTLSNPGGGALLGARRTADLNIGDNDVGGSIQFSAATYSANEKAVGGAATITVTRSGSSASDVTVQYSTSDGTGQAGTDYQTATGTITFDSSGPGATTQTFAVPIFDNGLPDGNRTVSLTLHTTGGGAVLGSRKTAVLTIVDDEAAFQFSQANYSVSESAGSVTITVTRIGPKASAVGVTYTVLAGSATPGADYGGIYTGELPFAVNQTTRTFKVTILNDTLAEGPETFLVQLSNPTGEAILGFRSTAVVAIVDNDTGGAFRFGASSYGASEASAFANVTVTRAGGGASNGKVRIRTVSGGTAVPGTDYQALDQVLDFAGLTSKTVPITLLTSANLTDEPVARTIKLELLNPEPLGLSSVVSPSTTTVTIGDNDVGGAIQFSPTSISKLETDGNAVLTVTRTGGAAMGAGATWEITTAGTAQSGTDYDPPLTGSVSFDTGPSQLITIPLIDRPGAHGTRTIQVKLKDPTGGAKLGASTAMVNVLDETVGFRLNQVAYSATEGNGSITVTILRTGPTQVAAQVTVRTVNPPDPGAGTAIPVTDYTPASQVLTFLAGQTFKTFTVFLKNDTALDGARTINLELTNPTIGLPNPTPGTLGEPHQATITVGDNDLAGTFRFTSATYTATEGVSGNVVVNITVTRSGGAGGAVNVPWSIVGGAATHDDEPGAGVDVILPASGVLQFGPNDLSETIQATIVHDTDAEPNETVILELGTPSLGGLLGNPKIARLVVVDNDRKGTIQFSAPLVNVAEANADVLLSLTRTGNVNDAVTATIEWEIAGGTATSADATGPGVDVVVPTTIPIEFLKGQTTKTIPLTIVHDDVAEGSSPPETLVVALKNPSAGWALGTVATTTLSLVEGTIQFSGLPLIASEASGSKTITVTRSGLTTQTVTVTYTVGPAGSATPASTPASCSPGSDYRPVTGTLVFSPGQPSKAFSVPLCGDLVVEGNETVDVTLAVDSGPAIIGPSGDTATLTITENDLAGVIQFSSLTYGASEGQGNAILTVTRTSTGLGAKVHWAVVGGTAIAGTDYSLDPLEGDIEFGSLPSKTIVIPLVNTTAADGPRTILVELSNPLPFGLASLGTRVLATLTINDNEPTLRLNSASYVIGEPNTTNTTFNVTVLRAGPAGAPLTVDLAPQQNDTATGDTCGENGADFADSVIPVTLTANQTFKTVPVTLCGDMRAEGLEKFRLALQNPVGATLANPSTATVSITDNELGGTLRWSAADASGVEGTTLLLTVTRTGGTATDVTVEFQAHDGDGDTPGGDAEAGVDYQVIALPTLTFGAGILSQTVEISLLPRDDAQGPRSFRVILHDAEGGAALGSPATATVWILDGS